MKHLPSIVLGTVLLSGLASAPVHAGERCEGDTCVVGIPSERVAPITASQRASQWCWAASIAMIMRYHGHPIAQETIVEATYGRLVDLPAYDGETMTSALARPWTDARGVPFRAQVKVFDLAAGRYELDTQTVIAELRAERPLLVGTAGHAMVVTAMTYRRTGGEPEVVSVTVRDPWPGQGRRELAWHEMEPTYVAAVAVAGPRAARPEVPAAPAPTTPAPVAPELDEDELDLDAICALVLRHSAEICGELADLCELACR